MRDKLITAAEAARRLGVSAPKMSRWKKQAAISTRGVPESWVRRLLKDPAYREHIDTQAKAARREATPSAPAHWHTLSELARALGIQNKTAAKWVKVLPEHMVQQGQRLSDRARKWLVHPSLCKRLQASESLRQRVSELASRPVTGGFPAPEIAHLIDALTSARRLLALLAHSSKPSREKEHAELGRRVDVCLEALGGWREREGIVAVTFPPSFPQASLALSGLGLWPDFGLELMLVAIAGPCRLDEAARGALASVALPVLPVFIAPSISEVRGLHHRIFDLSDGVDLITYLYERSAGLLEPNVLLVKLRSLAEPARARVEGAELCAELRWRPLATLQRAAAPALSEALGGASALPKAWVARCLKHSCPLCELADALIGLRTRPTPIVTPSAAAPVSAAIRVGARVVETDDNQEIIKLLNNVARTGSSHDARLRSFLDHSSNPPETAAVMTWNLHAWGRLEPALQDDIIAVLATALAPNYRFIETRAFAEDEASGGQAAGHRIAVFEHLTTGVSFSLIPAHGPGLPKPLLVARTPISQGQWERLGFANPSPRQDPLLPVTNLTLEAIESWLKTSGLRLPSSRECEVLTAREWGATGPWSDRRDALWKRRRARVWVQGRGVIQHATANLEAGSWNPFGLCDIIGNVWELCRSPEGDLLSFGGGVDTTLRILQKSLVRACPQTNEPNIGLRPVCDLRAALSQDPGATLVNSERFDAASHRIDALLREERCDEAEELILELQARGLESLQRMWLEKHRAQLLELREEKEKALELLRRLNREAEERWRSGEEEYRSLTIALWGSEAYCLRSMKLYEEAISIYQAIESQVDTVKDQVIYAKCILGRSVALRGQGKHAESVEACRRGIEQLRQAQSGCEDGRVRRALQQKVEKLVITQCQTLLRIDSQRSLDLARETLIELRASHSPHPKHIVGLLDVIGRVQLKVGDSSEAAQTLREALEIWSRRAPDQYRTRLRRYLAYAVMSSGCDGDELDALLDQHAREVAAFQERGSNDDKQQRWDTHDRLLNAQRSLLRGAGDIDAFETLRDDLEYLGQEWDALIVVAHALARCHSRGGDIPNALRELTQAAEVARGIGDRDEVAKALFEGARVLSEHEQLSRESRAEIRGAVATLPRVNPRLRAQLLEGLDALAAHDGAPPHAGSHGLLEVARAAAADEGSNP